MSTSWLLPDKNALVFGAAGAVGVAVAAEFAAQGASVFLSGRHLHGVQKVAHDIQQTGGRAEALELDALDEPAVKAYMDKVAQRAGSIDVVVNLIGPLHRMSSPTRSPVDMWMHG